MIHNHTGPLASCSFQPSRLIHDWLRATPDTCRHVSCQGEGFEGGPVTTCVRLVSPSVFTTDARSWRRWFWRVEWLDESSLDVERFELYMDQDREPTYHEAIDAFAKAWTRMMHVAKRVSCVRAYNLLGPRLDAYGVTPLRRHRQLNVSDSVPSTDEIAKWVRGMRARWHETPEGYLEKLYAGDEA